MSRRGLAVPSLRIAAGVLALLGLGAPGHGALDDTCVVSVLNRTVSVASDGTWVLPNVPANIGRVRARATCVENGATRSGQSAYFVVPRNGVVDVPDIEFDVMRPVPARLVLTAPGTTLSAAGATLALRATATYPDGNTADVSPAASGTNYTSSNPGIATVSADGLVTAVRSGTVLVTALNDGAPALLRLSVVLGGDTDGDGIPDDVELANGLNPRDPIDALEDYDGDGLVNRDEIARGTGLRDADSDDDGLSDGREVELGTEPLAWDSDGDGFSDKLEVDLGTNPLDPADFDLSRALASIRVLPPNVILVRNTLLSEASRRLQITGQLIDGRTLDLTSRQRGTQYTSSDLTVASFGAVDGEVFAGRAGSAVVTVSNAGRAVAVPVTVREFRPTPLAFLPIAGQVTAVDVAGDFAFVTSSTGLHVVDVTDRRAPRLVASRPTLGNADDVRVSGERAYVAVTSAGLQVFDLSDPRAPAPLWSVDTPGSAQGVAVAGDRVYVADGSGGLRIVSSSERREIGSLAGSATAGVDVNGTTAVLAEGSVVRVVDVAAPGAPRVLGTLAGLSAADLVVEGTLAYVANGTGSLVIVDFSAPAAPRRRHGPLDTSTAGMLADVAKRGPFTFGADFFFVNGVPIVDVTDPASPTWRMTLNFPPRDDNGTGIAVDAQYIYLVGNSSGGGLHIGQYLEITDDAGIPPGVELTAPSPGASYLEGTRIRVTAEASDDVAVASVTFLVDGVPASADTIAPYELDLDLPIDVTSVALSAVATDLGGNSTTSAAVTITLTPDPPPSVALVAPPESRPVMEGAFLTLQAEASDNIAVARVSFFVNGTEVAARTAPPYVATYRVPVSAPPSLTFGVEATDNLGRVARVSRDHAVGPSLTTVPAPLAVPPDRVTRPFTIRLSRVAVVDHVITLVSSAPSVAEVSPATVTIAAGGMEAIANIRGMTGGSASITLESPTLGRTQVPVFVTAEFVGLSTSRAPAVGVVWPLAPTPVPVPVDRLYARVGVAVGRFVTGVSPSAVSVGSADVPVVIEGGGLDAAATVSVLPPDGVTLGPLAASADGRTVTVPVTIVSDAAPTLRQLVVRDGSGQPYPARAGGDRLLVTLPMPEVASVNPLLVTPGMTGVTLLVRGRYLVGAQSVQVTPAAGITVGDTPVTSTDGSALSSLTVSISVAADAPLGPRVVTVTTPAGTSGGAATAFNTLTVVGALGATYAPIAAPPVGLVKDAEPTPPPTRGIDLVSPPLGVSRGGVVTTVAPRAGSVGGTLTLTLTGRDLQGATEVRFVPNTGVSVTAPIVTADGRELTVSVTLAPSAPLVARTVEVRAGGVVVPPASPAAAQFLVTAPLPEIISVSPLHVPAGAPLASLTIRGRHFRSTQQVRIVPPEDLTVGPPDVSADETEITVRVAAAAGAGLGPRVVLVQTAAGETPALATPRNTIQISAAPGTTYTPVVAPAVGVVIEAPQTPVSTPVGPIVAPAVGVVLTVTPPVTTLPVPVFAPAIGAVLGPVATHLEPAGAVRGAALTVIVRGHALGDVTSVSLVPAAGATVGGLHANAEGTELAVSVTVTATASLGARAVVLGGAPGRILFADPARATFYVGGGVPQIDSIDPILGAQGAAFVLTIRGRNFQDASAVTVTPAEGVAFPFPATVNAEGTQLTVPIRITSDATLGPRVIRVVTPAAASDETATPANTFTVFPP